MGMLNTYNKRTEEVAICIDVTAILSPSSKFHTVFYPTRGEIFCLYMYMPQTRGRKLEKKVAENCLLKFLLESALLKYEIVVFRS